MLFYFLDIQEKEAFSMITKKREKIRVNRICNDLGHSWILTTADNFRRCDRQDCKCVERKDSNGDWAQVVKNRKQTGDTGPSENWRLF
jgi:hypothetical protein